MNEVQEKPIFSLDIDIKSPLQNKLFSMMKGPIEHVLAFPRLNQAYADIVRMTDKRPFPDKVLEQLNVNYKISDEDLARVTIPQGSLIIVANHPFGGIEGIILASILRSIRCDVKFLANYLLNTIPEMRHLLICVNPFKGVSSVQENIRPVRECIQWVKNGGLLVMFPAGTVSHFDLQKGRITDPAWHKSVARIIRKTGASVLPIYFPGTNSATFHMAGIVHPTLRTALLPFELLNKSHKEIEVRIGDLIPFDRLVSFEKDQSMTDYLRLRTDILELRNSRKVAGRFRTYLQSQNSNADVAITLPQNPDIMDNEIRRLAPSQILAASGDLVAIQAAADQIPHILLEIGRLREITFRAVGEGTGKSADLDLYDYSYIHLFVWNQEKKEVAGAYRLGRTDELVNKKGLNGIYTSTLFRYKPEFLEHLGPALELGRSFVRLEYQKSYGPLLLLWKGIGRFVVDNPHYRTLFGPVSITDDYQAMSKELIVRFLKLSKYRADMATYVKARKPLRQKPLRGWEIDTAVRILKEDVDDVSELVSCIEKDGKGIPILLKQYLRLGGLIVGFNLDPAFGNALDGLIVIDLMHTDSRMLERYMGKEGARHYLAYHEALTRERYATCA